MKKTFLMIALLAAFSLISLSKAEAHERWPWWLPPIPVPAVVVAPEPVYAPAPVYAPEPVYAPAPAYGYSYNNWAYRPVYGRGWREGWRQRRLERERYSYGYRDHDYRGHRGWDDNDHRRGRHNHDD